MFGWFRSRPPRPPLDPPEKLWVEQQMSWLTQTLGLDRLRKVTVVLPTPEFFPEPFTGAPEQVRPLLDLVCRYMGVGAARLDLELFDGGTGRAEFSSHSGIDLSSSALGYYVRGERETILLDGSLLMDGEALIATMAHEVAHAPLLGDGLVSEDDPNHEYLTDLLTVFLGLGIFSANSVIRETSVHDGALYACWSIGKQGYLSERLYGYALAVFAHVRGEEAPAWAKYLRLNVRDIFTRGLDYLQKTSDTQFRPTDDGARELPSAERVARAVAALGSSSSGARLAALWGLRELGPEAEPALPALIATLADVDPFVQAEAAVVLGEVGASAEPALPALMDASAQVENESMRLAAVRALGQISGRGPAVVAAILAALRSLPETQQPVAVEALGSLGPGAAPAVDALAELLGHRNVDIACPAAESLGAIGPAAETAIRALIRALEEGEGDLPGTAALALGKIGIAREDVLVALRRAMIRPDEDIADEVAEALKALAPDAPLPEAPPPRRKRKR
jgi:HEAT repeat protein